VHHSMRQCPVVGHQQQPRGLDIQPTLR
jgi:hypothetical protein